VRQVEARERFGYVLVAYDDVDPFLRRAAGHGRREAAAMLGRSPGPVVEYFRAARSDEAPDFTDRRDLRGCHDYGSNVVRVSVELSVAEAREVAAHEVRHWAGIRDEDDAQRFGERFVDKPVTLT
jgi:hypothetical protein